jgi:ferredoxin-type protein NapH
MPVSRIRLGVQIVAFALLVYGGLLGIRRVTIAEREPSFPTLSCEYGRPIGKCFLYDLQFLLTNDAPGRYRRLIEPVLFFLGFGLLLGRAWCGWICPLGFIQDLGTRLRAAIGRRPIRLGPRMRSGLYWTAVGFLAATMFLAMVIGWPGSNLYAHRLALSRPYCQLCPSKQLSPLLIGNVGGFLHIDRLNWVSITMSLLGIALFLVFLGGMFAVRRFWCRICALGLLMRLTALNRWSLINLRKDVKHCTRCGNCARVCPVDIEEIYLERERADISPTACHLCLKCVESCPEEGVLSARLLNWSFFNSSFEYGSAVGKQHETDEGRGSANTVA